MKKIWLFLILPAFVACNEDFLEKQPLDKLSETAIFSSEMLMEQYVNALYNVVPHPFTEGSLAACTDEAFFHFGGTSCNRISRGELTPDNVAFEADGGTFHNSRMTFLPLWSRVFSYLRDMNVFLERVDNTTVSESVKNRLKGEVLFMRAWTYSNLLIRYSGVPIMEKAYQLGDTYDKKRDNYDACVDFVIKDLNEAIGLLADKAVVKGRVSADVCRALKARTYLYAASPLFNDPSDPVGSVFKGAYSRDKWKLARDAAKEFIDHGGYSLAPTYDDYWTNVNSQEVIWARYFDATTSTTSQYNAQFYYSPSGENIGGWDSCLPWENMVVDYEMVATGKKPFEDGSGYDPANPWAGRDPRFYKSILTPETEYLGKKIQICSPATGNAIIMDNDKWYSLTTGTNGTGYWMHKWLIDGATVSESINSTLMYPWFRLAEIYLIYAEAALEYNDDVTTCAEYINKIRDRADVRMPNVSSSLSVVEMRKKLIQERRIEYAFENQRYFDVRRWKLAPIYENTQGWVISGVRHDDNSIAWNIAKKGANGEPDFSDCRSVLAYRNFYLKHYLMPIPREEITKSGGVIVQNPYYDTDPELK
ncbi:MAG: RagB/SusD family nutrient uptake outer membrane protein [Candidatus Ordinivivax streblomastigis]|uniref:RagB/SusD family nutrient uptake outer membrane protein n=1 Tax=Candidatus Ordinivivax streblomastigis TaxID=2540710 RepID=A0A5M8NWZ0_9BACT|nr:MAG: RagB/SusD family nutrient uptake outer membrane protein [Candidatus Ordinivivax streblomastigis]